MLIAGELEDNDESLFEIEEQKAIEEVAELAIRSVVGFSDPGTMKLRGLLSRNHRFDQLRGYP